MPVVGMGTTMGELLVLPIYANLPTDMQDEAKKESDQYDKFECFCKKTIAELEENILSQAETNPVSQADVDKKLSETLGKRR
eukprot:Skav200044  [mRNA]  locus=scaffold337:338453:340895:+ [translate_table: standard]